MRKLIFLFIVTVLFTQPACEDEGLIGDTATIRLTFDAIFDGEPLVLDQAYDYQAGQKITFDQFSFYLSNVVLVEDEVGAMEILEINLLDFNNLSVIPDDNKLELTLTNIPVGTYSRIRMGIGVQADLNKTTVSDYSSNHSLGNDDFYWHDQNSYIFMILKGSLDTTNNGEPDVPFYYQSGTDDLFQDVTIPLQTSLTKGKTNTLSFTIDLKTLLDRNGETLDIVDFPNNLGDPQFPKMKELMAQFSTALRLNE